MPTGYTRQLEETNFNLEKWFLESLVRNFGLCVSLRDDGFLTQNEILERLKTDIKEPIKPHKRNEQELKAKFEENKKYLQAEIDRIKTAKVKYDETVAKVNQLEEKQGKSEMLAAIVEFAKQQLRVVADEYNTEYYEKELEISYDEFLKREAAGYDSCLAFYEKELEGYKKLKENGTGYDIYKALIDEVKEALNG